VVIDAWACSGDPTAETRAETLLNDMERRGLRPDSITYGAVINSHVNSGYGDVVERAEKVLLRMEHAVVAAKDDGKSSLGGGDGSGNGPTMKTYNQVLKAYSKSRLTVAARCPDVILNHMLRSLATG